MDTTTVSGTVGGGSIPPGSTDMPQNKYQELNQARKEYSEHEEVATQLAQAALNALSRLDLPTFGKTSALCALVKVEGLQYKKEIQSLEQELHEPISKK